MSGSTSLAKKLQIKDGSRAMLVLNASEEFREFFVEHVGPDLEPGQARYGCVIVFGKTNDEVKDLSHKAVWLVDEDGLLWACYPKKSSRKYKGSVCDRDAVGGVLAAYDYEPVRQTAIDEDWSALTFRQVDHIRKLTRKQAVSEKGKQRLQAGLEA